MRSMVVFFRLIWLLKRDASTIGTFLEEGAERGSGKDCPKSITPRFDFALKI